MEVRFEGTNKGFFDQAGNMVTGKAYRSIGVMFAIGGVLYLFMATRINRISVQDVVVFQPVPTDEARQNTFKIISKRLKSSTENYTDAKYKDTMNTGNPILGHNTVHENTSYTIRDKFIYPQKIIEAKIPNRKGNTASSSELREIVKVIGGKHFNSISNATVKEPVETNDNNITILSNKKIVIIVAYMRTGSTLTASVLQEYPGTFYVFEPIRSVHQVFKESKKNNKTHAMFNYIHGKQRYFPYSEEDRVRLDEINNWLTCRLDAVSLHSLKDDFHFHYTKIMKRFYLCAKGPPMPKSKGRRQHSIHPHLRRYFERSKNIDTCLKTAISYCQKAPLFIIKFIRMQMEEVLKLLPFYPNMKVIHLVRDPRGILNSRIKVQVVSRKSFQEDLDNHVNNHCSSVDTNLKYSKRILEKYENRLKIVHYEDMAEDPVGTARDLADFAGIEFLSHIKEYIRKQTSSTRDSCAYCTQRKNSNSTANKWRIQLNPKVANHIYEACKSSNSMLGYLPLNILAMKNQKIPSREVVDVEKQLLTSKTYYH